MKWLPVLTEFQAILSDLYQTNLDALRVAREAGLNVRLIEQSSRIINTWHSIIVEASHQDLMGSLVEVVARDYPGFRSWTDLAEPRFTFRPARKIGDDIQWQGEIPPSHIEKIIGRFNTLLPIGFLEEGLAKSGGVSRILLKDGSMGTGFLIGNHILLTCHHVLPDRDSAASAVCQFNFQKTWDGKDAPVDEYGLAPNSCFVTSAEDDWSAVRVDGSPSDRWEDLRLSTRSVAKNERVFLIQHPGGGPKQIGIGDNLVVFSGHNRLQYLSDTLPGSSGSPVFDERWNVVALHHSGGWIPEPGTENRFFRNEGIAASILRGALQPHLTSLA